MGFIERTEKKLGKYAISGLTMKLAVMQILFFVFYMLNIQYKKLDGTNITIPDFTSIEQNINKLNIGDTTVISDLIYLIASPPLLPDSSFVTYIFLFFAMHLFILYGTSLEELWGKYKFNLYILTSVLFALFTSQAIKFIYPQFAGDHLHYATSIIFNSVFFAFATYFPKFELLLFFVLPVKVRILAYILAAGLILFLSGQEPLDWFIWGTGLFGSYLLFHFHLAVNSQVQKARRANFDKKIGKLNDQAFHKCKVCGKTENDDENLEFRIDDDGEEYCIEHLKK